MYLKIEHFTPPKGHPWGELGMRRLVGDPSPVENLQNQLTKQRVSLAFPKSYRLPWLESRAYSRPAAFSLPRHRPIGQLPGVLRTDPLNLPVDSTADREQTFNVGTLPASAPILRYSYLLFVVTFLTASGVSQARLPSGQNFSQGKTDEFHQETPADSQALLYILMSIPGFFFFLFRHGLCPRQADRPRKRRGDRQQHRGLPRRSFRLGNRSPNSSAQAGFIFVALALYDLLKGVNRRQSLAHGDIELWSPFPIRLL